MSLNNNGDNHNNSRKRKMLEIAVEPSSPNGNNYLHSPNVAQVQRLLNSAAPKIVYSFMSPHRPVSSPHENVQPQQNLHFPEKDFSFMSLLTAPYHPVDDLGSDVKNKTEHINQIITQHSENMRYTLGGVLENFNHVRELFVEGKVASKIKEKEQAINTINTRNVELRNMLEFYKGESERLQDRVRSLEQKAMSLRRSIRDTRVARRLAERDEEDAESTFVDRERVEAVMLDCKACVNAMATIMMLPCLHVCVCPRCDEMSTVCPVCHIPKTSSIEVRLPPN